MLVGYMRVSTHEQTTDLQMDALIRSGVAPDWIYSDTGSGTRRDLPGWNDCNKVLRQGDTLIVWRLDRLGRSLQHLVGIVEGLTRRDVGLRILEGQGSNLDPNTAEGRMLFNLFAVLAEYERSLISERTRAGLAAARARGRKGGRPRSLTPTQVLGLAAAMKDRTAKPRELARELGISVTTLYNYVSETGELRPNGINALKGKGGRVKTNTPASRPA
ncbi:MAG: recombinase family protein [Paracoccaceae bacterium]|nr:recombinase family protein [Paracoccaceae bacterium]